jgi:hypothetical protein
VTAHKRTLLERALRRSDDPAAALALADLCEEQGREEEAAFWRAAGRWHALLEDWRGRSVILPKLCEELLRMRPGKRRVTVPYDPAAPGGWRLDARVCALTVHATLRPPDSGFIGVTWRMSRSLFLAAPEYRRGKAREVARVMLNLEAYLQASAADLYADLYPDTPPYTSDMVPF